MDATFAWEADSTPRAIPHRHRDLVEAMIAAPWPEGAPSGDALDPVSFLGLARRLPAAAKFLPARAAAAIDPLETLRSE
jgi:hypothetical protein